MSECLHTYFKAILECTICNCTMLFILFIFKRIFFKIYFIYGYAGSSLLPLCLVTKLYPTLCDPMDYSPPGSSVHGISQARKTPLECRVQGKNANSPKLDPLGREVGGTCGQGPETTSNGDRAPSPKERGIEASW